MNEIFKELPNAFSIADDILIVGYDDIGADHDITLCMLLQICWKENFLVN